MTSRRLPKTLPNFDGREPPVYSSRPSTVNVHYHRERKSMATAILLTFLFGPFGMFYCTPTGAGIMLFCWLLSGFVAAMTFGLSLIVTIPLLWVVQMVWAAMACD